MWLNNCYQQVGLPSLKGFCSVLSSYSFKVDTVHSLLSPGREGKKKLVICDVDLDCLAKVLGRNRLHLVYTHIWIGLV